MVRNKTEIPDDCVVFNFRSEKLQMSADDVPTLTPKTVMDQITAGDPDPYFKLQAIEYPATGNGIFPHAKAEYTEDFFQSFVDVTKMRPVPGSKRGHQWLSRPQNDFYMVGGKLEKKGNGKGTVIFKMYVPPIGDESANTGLIRDMKANIVHFSLVSRPTYEVDGDVQRFTKSVGAERNDAVEYGAGAMDQITNSSTSIEDARKRAGDLIKNRKFRTDGSWNPGASDDIMNLFDDGESSYPLGKNGIVYRSALHHTMNRAAADGRDDIASVAKSLIAAIGAANSRRGNKLDELIEQLQNMIENGTTSIKKIANALGMGDMIVSKEHTDALATVQALAADGVTDPVATIKTLNAKLAAVESDRVKNRLDAEFGPEKLQDGSENLLRIHAGDKLANCKADDLDAEIEKMKNDDPIAKQLAANAADATSEANRIGIVDNAGTGNQPADGEVQVIEL